MADITIIGIEQNISMRKGDTREFEFELLDSDETPLDMTGYAVNIQVRKSFTGSVVINATLQNDKVKWVNQSNGRFKWVISPSDTSSLTFPTATPEQVDYVYDVQVIAPTAFPGTQTPWYGVFSIVNDVTRVV